jgi:hypothetical protein
VTFGNFLHRVDKVLSCQVVIFAAWVNLEKRIECFFKVKGFYFKSNINYRYIYIYVLWRYKRRYISVTTSTVLLDPLSCVFTFSFVADDSSGKDHAVLCAGENAGVFKLLQVTGNFVGRTPGHTSELFCGHGFAVNLEIAPAVVLEHQAVHVLPKPSRGV